MSMKPECEEIRESLSPLVDGELSDGRRKAVSAHLLTCDECSEAVGRLVAAKGLVQRAHPQSEAPAGFMNRLQERIDVVEGVRERVRQPGRARRITAIAAAGAIAVSVAVILSTIFFINNDQALQLAQMHQQVTALPGPVPGGSVNAGYMPVSCDPARDPWREVHQTLVRMDGTIVTYTLYRVGNCPVSLYTGPQRWEPYRTGRHVTERANGLDVRQVGNHAMTSWVRGGRRHVLVATAPPEEIAALARAQMSSLGRSPGL